MKFKKIRDNEDNLKFFTETYKNKDIPWDDRMQILKEFTGKSERTNRKWAVKLGLKEKIEEESKEYDKAKERTFNKEGKYFFFTWAQNNTPVHDRLFFGMESLAKKYKAEIHVIAGRYQNPTSVFTDKKHDFWDPLVSPYLDAGRHDIHKYLSILADIKVQPTAVNPMNGLQGMCGINSCVFGSPKQQLETVPVLDGDKPKMVLTTGACTMPNYTDSKAGKKGEARHDLGFVIVEIVDEETFYIRQVTANEDGSFTDLGHSVRTEGKYVKLKFEKKIDEFTWIEENCGRAPYIFKGKAIIKKTKTIDSIILGDLHYGHHDQEVLDDTLGLMKKLKPKNVILHDVFDGYSISHHDMKDPFVQYQKEVNGTNCLETEVNQMLDGLEPFNEYENVVIVRSNHDDFIDRWLKNEDWRKQPTRKNSRVYMKYSTLLLDQYAEGNDVKGVIPALINERFPKFITLGRSSSYKSLGFELGQHGDIGANGSRGSLNQFRKLNTKMVVGHYHSPGRKDNVFAVGTTTKLRVGYNIGPSSWLQTHVIIHEDGSAQHIHYINNGFSTLV
jgi:hypothetical protein